MMEKLIKVTLGILFILCLLKMPYGFYQFIRFAALIGFSVLAYQANLKGRQTSAVIFISLAILFQPLFKIPLGRELWNIVDIIVAGGLLISYISDLKSQKT